MSEITWTRLFVQHIVQDNDKADIRYPYHRPLEVNQSVADGFPPQRASNAEKRFYVMTTECKSSMCHMLAGIWTDAGLDPFSIFTKSHALTAEVTYETYPVIEYDFQTLVTEKGPLVGCKERNAFQV